MSPIIRARDAIHEMAQAWQHHCTFYATVRATAHARADSVPPDTVHRSEHWSARALAHDWAACAALCESRLCAAIAEVYAFCGRPAPVQPDDLPGHLRVQVARDTGMVHLDVHRAGEHWIDRLQNGGAALAVRRQVADQLADQLALDVRPHVAEGRSFIDLWVFAARDTWSPNEYAWSCQREICAFLENIAMVASSDAADGQPWALLAPDEIARCATWQAPVWGGSAPLGPLRIRTLTRRLVLRMPQELARRVSLFIGRFRTPPGAS